MKIHDAIICDDVRVEASGKHILIGVYTSGMNFLELPAQIQIYIWLDHTQERTGETKFAVKGTLLPAGSRAFEVGAEMVVESLSSRDALSVGPLPIMVGQPGELLIEAKIDDGDWEAIRTLPLNVGLPQHPQPITQ